MRSTLAVITLFGVALGQNAALLTLKSCNNSWGGWYSWGTEDWAVDQKFNESGYTNEYPDSYLDSNDFKEGGKHYGKKWEDVFFTDPWFYRPLGFQYGVLGPFNKPSVCINVVGGGSYKVELMAYSFTPGASLAASDLSTDPLDLQSNGVADVRGQSKLYQCFMGPSNINATMQLSIFCPRDNCQEGETHLLWRLRRSGTSFKEKGDFASGNPEMWCMTIGASIQWPDQIVDDAPKTYSGANSNEYKSGALQVSVMLGTLLSIVFAVFQ